MMKKVHLLILGFGLIGVMLAVQFFLSANVPSDLQRPVDRAIEFIRGTDEPHALLWLDVMYRRFGIPDFANATDQYDAELLRHPDEAPLLRIFRRIIDYNNQFQAEDLKSVVAETDGITVPALYCGRMEFPADYATMLVNSASQGRYMLTHVLLAVIWIQENNGVVPLHQSFMDQIFVANAALINDDSVVTDLELEAAAFLYLSGHGSLVSGAFVNSVISAQNLDGGWSLSSDEPGGSHWHSTIVGLLILLHVKYPANSYEPTLASKA